MASRFKYDPEKINFDQLENNFMTRFWRGVIYVVAALVVALGLNFLFILMFDSPKERMIRRENAQLKEHKQQLLSQKARVDTVLKEITETDEKIFKLIFETEPAQEDQVMHSGMHYELLKNMTDEEVVRITAAKLDSMLEKTTRDKLDYDLLRIKSEDKAELLTAIPAVQPIENNDLSRTASGFGYRMHPIYKIFKFHAGMDYTAPVGTEVIATGAGEVTVAERTRRGSGNRVVIDHGFGYTSVYAHLDEIQVRRGARVERGDIIGTVGNTGLSTAPHLHYEVRINDEPVNPVNYFFLELNPEMYTRIIARSKNSGQSFD